MTSGLINKDVSIIIKTLNSSDSYLKVVNSLKRRKNGSTVADICAATALPLSTVCELLPKAADEYRGRLQVTQSGEILYLFPDGFKSRYRGFGVWLKRAAQTSAAFIRLGLSFLFKVWIMVMLIGYFVLFLALALASVFISVASKSSGSGRSGRGGSSIGINLIDLLIRLWFYSEITKPRYGNRNVTRKKKDSRPMHKAVFSFVFGEDDPNKDWQERQSRAIIAYIQANRGVISLGEYMAFTGESGTDAEQNLLSFCSKYAGSPEVTEEGTIVYRFDELLLRADKFKLGELSPPVKRLKVFSYNSKTMNGWFTAINAVNLFFGSYFLYQSFSAGQLLTEIQYKTASFLYSNTYYFLQMVSSDPAGIIRNVLGLTPFLFSLFFWLIPAVRHFFEKNENEEIKLANFKRFSFGKIWSSPSGIDAEKFLRAPDGECLPKDINEARERVIKDMGAIFVPEIEQDEEGRMIYSFKELENEKRALEKYRESVDPARSLIGKTVFDSGE